MSPHAVFVVVGGPSGAGKSSRFPLESLAPHAFNVDVWIKDHLNAGSFHGFTPTMRHAGLEACAVWVRERIARQESCAIEASLRREETFALAQEAHDSGFETSLIFISVSLRVALERVAARRQAGGHAADIGQLVEIYRASHANLARALREFDRVQVYDNSEFDMTRPLRPVLETEATQVAFVTSQPPQWLCDALARTPYALDRAGAANLPGKPPHGVGDDDRRKR